MSVLAAAIIAVQAEVIGESIGRGVIKGLGFIFLIAAAVGGFALFLWLVRRIDKKINK